MEEEEEAAGRGQEAVAMPCRLSASTSKGTSLDQCAAVSNGARVLRREGGCPSLRGAAGSAPRNNDGSPRTSILARPSSSTTVANLSSVATRSGRER